MKMKSLKIFLAALLASVLSLDPALIGTSVAMHIPLSQVPQAQNPETEPVNDGEDRETVRQFLEQKVVQERLAQLGYTQQQIDERLSQLSRDELHMVATHIESEAPAGDAAGALITILVIGILALLFVYLLKRV